MTKYLLSGRKVFVDERDQSKNSHLGLLLERGVKHIKIGTKETEEPTISEQYIKEISDKEVRPAVALFKKVADLSKVYNDHYLKQWLKDLKDLETSEFFKVKYCEATVGNQRMVVGLGAESVLENSIALHRTYGVPYIPGSALKGLASSYAHQRLEAWDKKSEAHKTMFGDADEAGFLVFYDALPVSGKWSLHPDVMTVHHQDYYRGTKVEGKLAPPADWDSPTPIPFISASGTFLIAIGGPEAWVNAAFEILRCALKEYGIGAKTSSGYGRLELAVGEDAEAPSPESPTP